MVYGSESKIQEKGVNIEYVARFIQNTRERLSES